MIANYDPDTAGWNCASGGIKLAEPMIPKGRSRVISNCLVRRLNRLGMRSRRLGKLPIADKRPRDLEPIVERGCQGFEGSRGSLVPRPSRDALRGLTRGVEGNEGIDYLGDVSRARSHHEGGTTTIGLQISMPDAVNARARRCKTPVLSIEEKRMAANAKRIRYDADAGTLDDVTGLRGKELLSRLLRN